MSLHGKEFERQCGCLEDRATGSVVHRCTTHDPQRVINQAKETNNELKKLLDYQRIDTVRNPDR